VSGAPGWRDSRAKRLQASAIAAAGYPLVAALGRTLRWIVDGREHLEAVERLRRPPIMVFWHGRILTATVYFQRRGIVVITSENFDGEWIARIIERFGYGTARGSSSRGAVRALVRMKRDLAAGRPVGFTLDGPRGPAREAQPGAFWLARASGCPLLPFHLEAERCWTLRSWDATQIPKPFSRVALSIGEPVLVPQEASDEEVEGARRDIEARLAALAARACRLVGKDIGA
jgi:lysophospholipid acyltransferase (LPLAT)-like uncharacterized protein